MKINMSKLWKENRSLILFLALMCVFRSAVADWNDVPTGSMKPTIIEGDRIYVDKMAYDVRVPFTLISMFKLSDPQVGDIIVFDSVASDKRLVKRVVGVPGDVVSMKDNVLTINGETLKYDEVSSSEHYIDLTEVLGGIEHAVRVKKSRSPLSSFAEITVPENVYLALGDNRDNSADSRVIGFIPRNEIVGKSSAVVFSTDYDNYYIPRAGRFFHSI